MRKAAHAVFISLLLLIVTPNVYSISSFTRYSQNPIINNGQNPSVIYKDGYFKMWYEVNYGQGWQINYGYSPDGVNNWVMPNSTVISNNSFDGFEVEKANPFIIYDNLSNQYKIWYTSIGSNWSGGSDRFRLGYATSSDGVNWTKYDNWVLKGTTGTWDNGGIARGISVLQINGIFHLWYSATDEGWNWRIGYATSLDGINWVKQNNGNPVLSPTESWEQTDLEYPSVIYRNGIYEMFYTSAPSDMPNKFLYATSTDGINWTKSPLNPILTVVPGIYEHAIISGPFPMRLSNGTTMLWYGGNSSYIMLATDGPIPTDTPPPLETPSPTPNNTQTPTPTFTPTPFPTFTPTPTPIPSQTKKIIIIPGMAGSWNNYNFRTCSSSPYTGIWTQTFWFYSKLRDQLENDGFTPYIFAYDWRRPISENGAKLEQYINTITEPNEKVSIAGHSMGGLVARWYLEHTQLANKLDKLLTIGSPHNGSNLSYPAWAGGELWSKDPVMRGIFSFMTYSCKLYKNIGAIETIHSMVPSFQNTLPVYDYLKDRKSAAVKSVSTMINQNNWLPTSLYQNPFYGVIVGSLTGTGYLTDQTYYTNPANKSEIKNGLWLDGKPYHSVTTQLGDGTVLNSSSYVPTAQNWTVNLGHGDLVRDDIGINEISSFFSPVAKLLSPLRMAIQNTTKKHKKETTSVLMVVSDSGIFTVTDPKRNQTSDEEGLVIIEDPISGKYSVSLTPANETTTIYIGQIFENNKTLWKHYTLRGKTKLKFNLRYDHEHKKEDILERFN